MSSRASGHRGVEGDSWSWGQDEPGGDSPNPGSGGPGRPAFLLIGLGALGAFIGLLVLQGGGDETPSPPSSTTAGAQAQEASPTPSADGSLSLAIWSRAESAWRTDTLPHEPVYVEGDVLPFMVRIDQTDPGAIYKIQLRYQCQTATAAAFDYLGGRSDKDASATLTDPGPGRRPDSTLPMPDDPSIAFDDAPGRRFEVWGGTFHQPPEGPQPPSLCLNEKTLSVSILAQGETVFLVLGAHLASSRDWGDGKGAAAQPAAINLAASVDDGPAGTLTVPPEAIAGSP